MGAQMKGADLAMMLAMLGGSAIGGLTQPGAQELNSFHGQSGIDPSTMLGEAKGMTGDVLDALLKQLAEPVTMKTTVNPLPSFTGAGLPMPIAAPGMDANRLNPNLRTTPGINVGRRSLTPSTPGGSSYTPSPNAVDTGRQAVPRPGYIPPNASKDDSALPRIPEMPSTYQLPVGGVSKGDGGDDKAPTGRRTLPANDMVLDSTGRTMKNGGFAPHNGGFAGQVNSPEPYAMSGQGDPLEAIKILMQNAGARG